MAVFTERSTNVAPVNGGGRSAMKSYQPRPDKRIGAIMTTVEDNLVIETYEK